MIQFRASERLSTAYKTHEAILPGMDYVARSGKKLDDMS